MLLFLSIVIGFSAVAILVAGLLAFLRNPTKPQNRWFLGLSVALALWIPFNFIDSNFLGPTITSMFLRLDFATAPFIAWTLLEFVEVFSVRSAINHKRNQQRRLFLIGTLVLNILIASLSLIGLIVTSNIADGRLTVHYSSIFIVYIVVLLGYFGYAFGRLAYKRKRAKGSEQAALSLIYGGLIIAVSSNLLTNLVFPLVIHERLTVKALNIFGYFGFLMFVFTIYLAITTQKLFDVRLIVARSLTYVLSLGSIGSIFVLATITVTNLIFGSRLSPSVTRAVYTLLAVLLALFFPILKKYFDTITNRLFFRDAYDSQDFLDQFNKVLVSTYEVEKLIKNSTKVIEQFIKPSFTVIGLKATVNSPQRVIGAAGHPKFNDADIDFVRHITPVMNRKMIVVDALEEKYDKLRVVLQQNNIALITRLTPSVREEGAGYLILGPKKSGNLYSSQDLKVLEIISNELVIAIQNVLRFEEIGLFNITLQEKVNDATHKLRRTNEKLKQLDETKDDFISMASHQLRTPLTSVKGYISMVLEEDAGKITATQRDMLGQAFFGSQRMVYLIADLLNVSRLKTGKFIMEPTKINLATMIEQEMSQLRETAAARELTLRFDKPDKFPDVLLDETKTRQVVMNFIDNAIYYTPAGGRIRILLSETASTIEMRVEDDGIGVPKAEQSHLFTKFYRAGNARHARPDGTGLGLFMAKKVILGQGGSVLFDSEEGKGSMFGFVFSKRAVGIATAVQVLPPVSKPQESLAKV